VGLGGVLKGDVERAVLADDLIGAALDGGEDAGVHGNAFEIDGGALGAEVEADGLEGVEFLEDGGEEVLTGVLLHVIEAARPIDEGIDLYDWRGGRGEAVSDAVVLIDDVDHGDAGERAGIEGLAAGGGIEGGAVEVDGEAVGRAVYDAGAEVVDVGIGVVETFGHDACIVANVRWKLQKGARRWYIEEVALPIEVRP
jgi:hypothetical protein